MSGGGNAARVGLYQICKTRFESQQIRATQ